MEARAAQPGDYPRILELLDAHPVEGCQVGELVRRDHAIGLTARWVWLHGDALCYTGANLLPVNADPAAVTAFAARALGEGRRCSSIVGRLPAMRQLWELLEPAWGPARAVRERQIVMVSGSAAPVAVDPDVREATAADFDHFYNASIEMYIEEIGVSPVAHDNGHAYRARVSDLIGRRLAFIRVDDGQVVFKAELGALTPSCAQLQGVWVHPDFRGTGLGAAGTARVLELARERGIGTISLAVNDYNDAARHVYRRCGFREAADQMVVLF